MKNSILFAIVAITALFVACGNPSHVTSTSTTCDSCQVDSIEVETVVSDSVSTDTISE